LLLLAPRDQFYRPPGHSRLDERDHPPGSVLLALLLQPLPKVVATRRELVQRQRVQAVDLSFERGQGIAWSLEGLSHPFGVGRIPTRGTRRLLTSPMAGGLSLRRFR